MYMISSAIKTQADILVFHVLHRAVVAAVEESPPYIFLTDAIFEDWPVEFNIFKHTALFPALRCYGTTAENIGR
jgi:hypothetical protein